MLMLDQRGTGRSAPIAALEKMSSEEQASYLACFRADSIVDDAELIRNELGLERWSVLGQSFGGFCVLRYLSSAPAALAEAFLTGGLPPVGRHPTRSTAPPMPEHWKAVADITNATRRTRNGPGTCKRGWRRTKPSFRMAIC